MNLIESSKEIIDKAIADYSPYATVLMLSGGDDSMTALHVARQLGVKIDFIMHGITGTGIQQTRDFVRSVAKKENCVFIEADAGDAYYNYVTRKGFFGVGTTAHAFAYHVLKADPFRAAISKYIRKGKPGRRVLLINGGRRLESDNRKKTFIYPVKIDKKINVWVNIINEWPNHSTTDFLEANNIDRNPVSKLLCTSGECCCGTMLQPCDAVARGALFPEWKKWFDWITGEVKRRGFPWGWAESMPKGLAMENRGQMNMFQPMCTGCKINQLRKQEP